MFSAATLLLMVLAPAFDEGYDLLVLDLPHRAVLGDTLPLEVRGRPEVPYVVMGDLATGLTRFGNVWIQLALGPALVPASIGQVAATGRAAHTLGIPAIPALHGLNVYFQAFGLDKAAYGGWVASDSKVLTLERERGQPLVTLLTVNRIPRDQNAADAREGTLVVPPEGFSIDVFFADRGKGAIDPQSLFVSADVALGNGSILPGTNLAGFLTVTASQASGSVASSWAFPLEKQVTLKARVKNAGAVESTEESYTFFVRAFTAAKRPFASRQLWYLDFLTADLDNTSVPDFREDLLLYGLGSDAKDQSGPSALVFDWVKRETQRVLRANYGHGTPDAVDVDFLLAAPPTTHAKICVGGRNSYPKSQLPPYAQETTGAAYINPNNQTKNHILCGGVLGVHPRSIYWLFKDVPAFQQTFGALLATPVGKHVEDPIVTQPSFDPRTGTRAQAARYEAILAGVRAMANSTGFVLTQETGHAMGLTLPGRLPSGLLGGLYHGHSTDYHFDDGRGSFMSGNNSTPAPAEVKNLALIWDHFQSGRGHWTALEWAYLRERIVN